MEGIDDYLLAKILGFVPRDDQLNLFQISKRWYKVMDECVGIDVLMGRGTTVSDDFEADEDMNDDDKPKLIDPMKLISTLGVRSCTFNFFVNDSTVPPKLKYPALLHFIYFKNFVSSKTFESILHGVTNLHTLKIDSFVLHHLEFNDMSVSLPCQVLEIGTGGCIYTASYVLEQSSFEIMSLNITHLLRNSFPGLKIVKMFVPTVRELLETVTEEVVNFLYSHAESLTRADVSMFPYSLDPDENYELAVTHPKPLNVTERPFENLRKLLLGDDNDGGWRYLKINSSFQDFWMKWACNVLNLEEVTFRFPYCEVLALVKSIVQKNEATLKIIKIVSRNLISFDCGILQNCKNLKNLEITGGFFSSTLTEKNASAELHKAQLLPKTLVRLQIENIPITNETCKVLCLELPNLEVLNLAIIGKIENFGYGVPIDVAREMLQRKQIKAIMVQTGTGAGTQDNNIKNLLENSYKYKSSNYFVGYLGDNGEYSR